MDDFLRWLTQLLLLIKEHGLTVVSAIGLLLLVLACLLYGPRIFNGHIDFVKAATDSTKKQADCLAILTASHGTLMSKAEQIDKRLEVGARADSIITHAACDIIEHFGEKLEIADKVEDPVNTIRRELSRVNPVVQP